MSPSNVAISRSPNSRHRRCPSTQINYVPVEWRLRTFLITTRIEGPNRVSNKLIQITPSTTDHNATKPRYNNALFLPPVLQLMIQLRNKLDRVFRLLTCPFVTSHHPRQCRRCCIIAVTVNLSRGEFRFREERRR